MLANSSKKRYLEIDDTNQNFIRSNIINFKDWHRRKLSFISELAFLLTTHNASQDEFKIISKLIIFTLKAPISYFYDSVFSLKNYNPFENYEIKEYLITVKKVSILLKQPLFLSIQQILKNCAIERFFINMFLKDFLIKNQSFT